MRVLALSSLLLLSACYIDDPVPYEPIDAGTDASSTSSSGGGGGAGGSAPECTADATCDDGAPCTIDHCAAGRCTHDPAPGGTVCGDSPDACTGASKCDDKGACVAGLPVPTDDGNACTVDACDPQSGTVTHTPTPGCTVPVTMAGAPSARQLHSAVWTGDRMIVWGGLGAGSPAVTATGGRYDPAADAWTETSTNGAPAPRHSHCAVWTGTRMIPWGGFTGGVYVNDGGALDPEAAAWTALATAGAPSPRSEHAAVWTGTRMIVWGGCGMDSCAQLYGDGGTWTPDAGGGSWTPIAASPNAAPRRGPTAVWTGSAVVVWGGRLKSSETNTGARIFP